MTDDVPLLLETPRRRSRSRGPAREERLGPALPRGFVPLALDSPLPARFDPDGRLARAGAAGALRRSRSPRATRARPSSSRSRRPRRTDVWAREEVWVFEARPALRLVTVEGAVVDPQQTSLPHDWSALPAYRMAPGATLRLVERRRGDAEPAPDELTLVRRWYLDFDGGGATVSDRSRAASTRARASRWGRRPSSAAPR